MAEKTRPGGGVPAEAVMFVHVPSSNVHVVVVNVADAMTPP